MKQFNYKGNKFEIGLQTICGEECIVTKGYEIEDDAYNSDYDNDDKFELFIGTNYIRYDNAYIIINNNVSIRRKSNYEQDGRTYEKLIEHIEKICNEREEIDFICDDFHIKLWQTEDEIGGETVFVREGFEYNEIITIDGYINTQFWSSLSPIFGMKRKTYSIPKKELKYSFSDIAEALQEAVEYSKKQNEVTFDTFYNECKGKKPEEIVEICKGYEYRLWEFEGGWSDWEEVDYFEFRSKELYNFNLRQIRRKK